MSTEDMGGRDPLEKILLLAGRRKPVDPARAKAIEERTHERWQLMLARRRTAQRRRRFMLVGGSLALAASIAVAAIFVSRLTTEAPEVATVVKVLGAPETGARGHAMTRLQTGATLHAGSVLETAEGDGVALQLFNGHSLRVAAASRVRIESDSVVLDAGAIYIDSGGKQRETPIEVRSRLATVRELGTQYMVHLTARSVDVSVREGSVRVAQGNVVATAHAGELLQLNQSGQLHRRPTPEYGEDWAWVTELALTPDLDRMTLAEFLRWIAREQGWRLEFATPELASYANKVGLHGNIEGLSGEEALSVVMASTGWRYRLENGSLTIVSREEADQ